MTPKTSFNLQSKFSLTDCDRTVSVPTRVRALARCSDHQPARATVLPSDPSESHALACAMAPHTAAYLDLQNRHGRPLDVTEVATVHGGGGDGQWVCSLYVAYVVWRLCKPQETVLKETCWISFPCSSMSVCRSCAVITEGENWSYTVNLLLHVCRIYACNGPSSELKIVLSEICWMSFSTTFFDISTEWMMIVCLALSRIPVFLKEKKNHSQAGKLGRLGMINNYFFYLA